MQDKRYSFLCDYNEGAHPDILQAMIDTNDEQLEGYGEDAISLRAQDLIKEALQDKEAEVHFVSGGTQANYIVIASALRPYESVISASTGHIHVHETGAIEAKGHKINLIESPSGKLSPNQIKPVLEAHVDEHMVRPKLVYISNSTEIGAVYTKKELVALHEFCQANDLFLFMDGARLGSALMATGNDVKMSDLTRLTDACYIGGTKNGALIGEAIVLSNPVLKNYFRYHIKQNGGLLAKGRLLGIQFRTLFEKDLYYKNAAHSNAMAAKIGKALKEMGIDFLNEPISNQIFPILDNQIIDVLEETYQFYRWCVVDEKRTAIRLVTSWATPETQVKKLIKIIAEMIGEKSE